LIEKALISAKRRTKSKNTKLNISNEALEIRGNLFEGMNQRESEWKGTCLTDSAISGPMPSPGKRVARIGVEAEEKAL
jgi:hypothetical protein